MKKLNILFRDSTIDEISELDSKLMNNKSEIARAAINIGIAMLKSANESMTDRELYDHIINNQKPSNI